MNVLITGGAGFIGSHLVEAMVKRPEVETIRVADNLSTGRRENIEPFLDRIEFLKADLLDADARAAAVRGMDVILHQAALPGVPRSVSDPVSTHRHGAHLTLLLLHDAARAGARRVVFASSSSVYGEVPPPARETETMLPAPRSPYAATKVACEQYLAAFARCGKLDAVSLRYFNVFGPRQRADSPYAGVLARFRAAFRDGTPLRIHGDGEQSRDFTYVANVVRAVEAAARRKKPFGGVAVNVACGESTTLNRLVALLNELTGENREPEYGPPRPGDVRRSLADLTRAEELLGYRPTVDLREGLRRM